MQLKRHDSSSMDSFSSPYPAQIHHISIEARATSAFSAGFAKRAAHADMPLIASLLWCKTNETAHTAKLNQPTRLLCYFGSQLAVAFKQVLRKAEHPHNEAPLCLQGTQC